MIAAILLAALMMPGDRYEVRYREVWTQVQTCVNGRCYVTYQKQTKPYVVKIKEQTPQKRGQNVRKKQAQPKKKAAVKTVRITSLFGLQKPKEKATTKKTPLTFGL